jgi:hypothetical protein
MKTLSNPIAVSILAFGLLLYLAKLFQLNLPNWVHYYAADLLCMPLVLLIILALLMDFYGRQNFKIPLSAIVSLTVYYALFFEWLLPKISQRYTADWLDVLMYVHGALAFYLLQRKNLI